MQVRSLHRSLNYSAQATDPLPWRFFSAGIPGLMTRLADTKELDFHSIFQSQEQFQISPSWNKLISNETCHRSV